LCIIPFVILVYITCKSITQAKRIGKHLVTNRLAACINIFPNMQSSYFWPPEAKKLINDREVVLIAKTIAKNFKKIEKEITRLHSYKIPCVFSIKVDKVNKPYLDWLSSEVS